MNNISIALLLIAFCLLVGGLIGSAVTIFTLKKSGGISIKMIADKQFREVIDNNYELQEREQILKETITNLVQELCWCNNCLMCKHLNTEAEEAEHACLLGLESFTCECDKWKHHILSDVELDYSLVNGGIKEDVK